MPGFGTGSFSAGFFGESRWSKLVFWTGLPSIYKLQDQEQGGIFEKFMDGIRPSFDGLREKIRLFDELRDPLRARTQYDQVQELYLGPRITPRGDLEQKGREGVVSTWRVFSSPNARFREADIGKDLIVSGSSVASNNTTVRLISIQSLTSVITDPQLTPDTGPLRWELRTHVDIDPNVMTVQVQSGTVDEIAPGWILFDGTAEFTVVARRHFKVGSLVRSLAVEANGEDGVLLPGGILRTDTPFGVKDVGKKIILIDCRNSDNNGEWEIGSVSGTGPYFVTLTGTTFTEEVGPLTWSLWPFAELDLYYQDVPKGVALQSGVDLSVTAPNIVSSPTASFTTLDVGKFLTVYGPTGSGFSGTYAITGWLTPSSVTVDATFAGAATNLTWYVRNGTNLAPDNKIGVRVSAPPLLGYLAKDFGITVDAREDEVTQRSWVYNVAGWTGIKGTEVGYSSVGKLGGFVITVSPLWHVTTALYRFAQAFDPASVVIFPDTPILKSGSDGFLVSGLFVSATGNFVPADVGKQIYTSSTARPENEGGLFTIHSVLNSTTVEILATDGAVFPDSGTGTGMQWRLVRLYTTKVPSLPHFDDFDSDLMQEIIDGTGDPPATDYFGIDKICWEEDWVGSIPILMTGAPVQLQTSLWQVPCATPPGQVASWECLKATGNWALIDAQGEMFFLDALPVGSGTTFTLDITSFTAPSWTGPESPRLQYVCDEIITCSWCPSNKVLLKVELGETLVDVSGPAVENIFQRALDRIEQAKPAHVELVIQYSQAIASTVIHPLIEIEPKQWFGHTLDLQMVPLYDDIPADVWPDDAVFLITVEPRVWTP